MRSLLTKPEENVEDYFGTFVWNIGFKPLFLKSVIFSEGLFACRRAQRKRRTQRHGSWRRRERCSREHGYRASTVRQICQRAHTHVGSVNYHFRDKKGLYAAIFGQSLQLAVTRYPPDLGLAGQATPEEKLRAYIYSLLLRLMGEGLPAWHGKLLAKEMAEPSGALDELLEHSIRPLYTYLAGIVRELTNEEKPAGGEESDRTFLTSLSIVGQCFHHHIARHFIAALRSQRFRSCADRKNSRSYRAILSGRHSRACGGGPSRAGRVIRRRAAGASVGSAKFGDVL